MESNASLRIKTIRRDQKFEKNETPGTFVPAFHSFIYPGLGATCPQLSESTAFLFITSIR